MIFLEREFSPIKHAFKDFLYAVGFKLLILCTDKVISVFIALFQSALGTLNDTVGSVAEKARRFFYSVGVKQKYVAFFQICFFNLKTASHIDHK